MKKRLLIIGAILFLLWTVGCYESKIPLSTNISSKIDPKLVNYWSSVPKQENDTKYKLAIFKFNENEYLISWRENQNETVITRGYITNIDNIKIMNIQNIETLDKIDRTYLFFKYSIDDKGILKAQILSDENVLLKDKTFNSPEEFRTFIKKNIKHKKLFGELIEFKPIEEFNIKIE